MRCFSSFAAVIIGVALVLATHAFGQQFPSKPVRIVVPYPPGGGADAFARIVGSKLSESWGQQVIIDNRGGGQGNIGTILGARAAPDGYTLTFTNNAILAINPFLYPHAEINALSDFAAVARGTEEAWIIVVHPSLPARSMKELATLAKRNPNKLNFASSSAGAQLVGELFKQASGTTITHVSYGGSGPAVIDLLAGNVQIMYGNPAGAVPHVMSGKLRALAVTGNKRLSALPDVHNSVEAGFPELNVLGWYGIVAPAMTTTGILDKLNADIVRLLNDPSLRKRIEAIGQTPAPSTREEFQAQIRSDYERWGNVVKRLGGKLE